MVALVEYEKLRERPLSRVVMTQRWRSLLFLHAPVPVDLVQALLPPGLQVDTFPDDTGVEMAWIALVPFRMEGVTPKGFPEIPGIHAFPETNVRTYVHRNGKNPGVWFFSLEAANHLACWIARKFFHLPYHEAAMQVSEQVESIRYRCRRKSNGAVCDIDARMIGPLAAAVPGTREFFFLERYLLYSKRGDQLLTGRVHHAPYQFKSVSHYEGIQSLTDTCGIPISTFKSQLFSPGVDVEVFGLQSV